MKPYYQRGDATIYLGDCRDVLPTLTRDSVDLLLTDPPYGVKFVSNSRRKSWGAIAGDDGSLDVPATLAAACRALRRNRHAYVFGPEDLLPDQLAARAELVWQKTNGGVGMGDVSLPWGRTHERITFATHADIPSDRKRGAGRGAARLRQGSVLAYPKPCGAGACKHPTEKPVGLLRRLIESSSLLGDVVLDPFIGSGSTAVAAVAEGRRIIGIEIDPRYVEVAARRVDAALDQAQAGEAVWGTPRVA